MFANALPATASPEGCCSQWFTQLTWYKKRITGGGIFGILARKALIKKWKRRDICYLEIKHKNTKSQFNLKLKSLGSQSGYPL